MQRTVARRSFSNVITSGSPLFQTLAQDLFTTNRAAGAINGTSAEPGPGTRVVTDTGSLLTISGGKLTFAASATGTGNPGYWLDVLSRECGIAAICQISIGGINARTDMGFDTDQSAASNLSFYLAGGGEFRAQAVSVYAQIGTYTTTDYFVATILRDTGQWYAIKGGVYTDWTLLMIDNVRTDTPIYPAISARSTHGGALTIDSLRISKLNGGWDTQYGIATEHIASSAINEITTSEANAVIEVTITAATGVTQELSVRRTDDNNRYIIRMTQGDSTIKLIREEAGIETELSSAAQTWTNNTQYRIIVQLAGTSMRTWVGSTTKNSATSQTFNQSVTGVKMSHAATELITWPYALSGNALSALNLAIS